MKLLHLDSSIQGDASASRKISAVAVERLRAADPGIEVTYRDLAADPLDHITMEGFQGEEAKAILKEFQAADIVVIGAGLYNFTLPSQLKAWIDRILIAGETFRYGEKGPIGLAGDKQVIVGLARGAIYSGDSPFASYEHAETLLRGTLAFIGIKNPQFIIAEGLRANPELGKAALAGAIEEAEQVIPERLVA